MSNAFDEMMSRKQIGDNDKPSLTGGRPMHEYWYGYIHNDIRNRLSAETSKKLAQVYFTLRAADQIMDENSDIESEI